MGEINNTEEINSYIETITWVFIIANSNMKIPLYSIKQLNVNYLKILLDSIYELLNTKIKVSRKAVLKVMTEISEEFEKKGILEEITDIQTKILNKL